MIYYERIVNERKNLSGGKRVTISNQYGQVHNDKGPAIIDYGADGTVILEQWVITGALYCFEDWLKYSSLTMDEKVELKLLR